MAKKKGLNKAIVCTDCTPEEFSRKMARKEACGCRICKRTNLEKTIDLVVDDFSSWREAHNVEMKFIGTNKKGDFISFPICDRCWMMLETFIEKTLKAIKEREERRKKVKKGKRSRESKK